MDMEKRAEVNIKIANHLNDLTQEEICTTYNNIQNNADIRHIIIGRWYYGLFLLAKHKLINDYNFVKNCTEKNTCHHYTKMNGICNAKCLKHKSYWRTPKNGTSYMGKLSIWGHIANKYPPEKRKSIKRGEELASLREKFEYNGEECQDSHMKKATKYFEGVINGIK